MLAHFDHAGDVETDHRAAARFAQRTLTVYSKAFTAEQRRGLASHLSAAQLTPTGATAHAAAGKCAACELLRQQLPSELREAGLCGSPKRRPTKGAAASEQSGGEHSAGSRARAPLHSFSRAPRALHTMYTLGLYV